MHNSLTITLKHNMLVTETHTNSETSFVMKKRSNPCYTLNSIRAVYTTDAEDVELLSKVIDVLVELSGLFICYFKHKYCACANAPKFRRAVADLNHVKSV